jgi:hypothetical protein
MRGFLRTFAPNAKGIKKIHKILVIVVLVILSMPVSFMLVLSSPKFQTHLTAYVTSRVKEKTGIEINIDGVDFAFFDRLILEKMLIKDHMNDTLIYADEFRTSFSGLDFENNNYKLGNTTLNRAFIRIYRYPDYKINIREFINSLKSDDTTSVDTVTLNLLINNIEFVDSRFVYQKFNKEYKPYGMNYRDVVVSEINGNMANFEVRKDTILFRAKDLSAKEKSGLYLKNFNAEASLHEQFTKIRDAKILTDKSYADIKYLSFYHNGFRNYIHFIDSVKMDAYVNSSDVNFIDISYFSPSLQNFDYTFNMSGKVYGLVNSLKGKKVKVSLGDNTNAEASFDVRGLPAVKESFFMVDIPKASTDYGDLRDGLLVLFPTISESQLRSIAPLDSISFNGNITGFYDDIVAYGDFKTAVGNLSLDLSLKNRSTLGYSGTLSSDRLDLGTLFSKSPQLGTVAFDTKVDGNYSSENGITADTETNIKSLFFNKYDYKNITFSGLVEQEKFNGTIYCRDPNLKLNFVGAVNYSKENPAFDFNAIVTSANLHKLNLYKKDSIADLSFAMSADFTGLKFEDINGTLDFRETILNIGGRRSEIDKISLFTENTATYKKINLISDILDVNLEGDFDQGDLVNSIQNTYYKFFPSYYGRQKYTAITDSSDYFNVKANFKDLNGILKTFGSNLKIAENSSIKGGLTFEDKEVSVSGSADYIRMGSNLLRDVSFSVFGQDTTVFLKAGSKTYNYGPAFILHSPEVEMNLMPDSLNWNVRWNNTDSLKYSADIRGNVFQTKDTLGNIVTHTTFFPSEIIVSDKKWSIGNCGIDIDSTSYAFNNIKISNSKSQSVEVIGTISESSSDTLNIELNNFNFSELNIYTESKGFNVKGWINGKARLVDMYNNAAFFSDIYGNDIFINDTLVGNGQLLSRWDNDKKRIAFDLKTYRDRITPFHMFGNYKPASKEIDMNLALSGMRIHLLQSFWKDNLSDVKGLAYGSINLSGTLSEPLTNGHIGVRDGAFTVNLTKTRYYFDHHIDIIDNELIVDNFEIVDSKDNYANISASLTNNYFKDFSIDAITGFENLTVLNTKEWDNDSYYGNVFLSGGMRAKGPVSDLVISVNTTTEKGTELFIPLGNSGNVMSSSFLSFVDRTKDTIEFASYDWDIDPPSIGVDMIVDLAITPDAKIKIIIDSKIGDVIKGEGRGNIHFDIKKDGDPKMYGEYVFDKGDYLFTLQNVINKKFNISNGSKISWTGEPNNAQIDLKAVYGVKASLSQIFPEDSARYSRRIPVDCEILMTGNLKTPEVAFNLALPTADAETQARLENLINTEEKLNKQFLSLLVINSFYPETNTVGYSGATQQFGSTGLNTTASELLSNQLSLWLSQISKDFDIGVNYRPGDEISRDEVEIALSTQLLNDRVTINGNVDYGGNRPNNQNMAGEFNIEVKANKSGTIRFKGFNRANDQMIYQTAPYTQGVGVFYTEEFDTFGELWRKYKRYMRNIFVSKKKRELKEKQEKADTLKVIKKP